MKSSTKLYKSYDMCYSINYNRAPLSCKIKLIHAQLIRTTDNYWMLDSLAHNFSPFPQKYSSESQL